MKLVRTLTLMSYITATGLLSCAAQAQTFTNLHNFTGSNLRSSPYGGLIKSGTTFYGTSWGGGLGTGIVFKINADGSGKTTLHEFSTFGPGKINSDGASPYASLLLSGTTLYGTASTGGTSGYGTLFSINIDGSGFKVLHSFDGDGAVPMGNLIISGNTLYGTSAGASDGAEGFDDGSSFGTVFKISASGTGFTTIYTFMNADDGTNPMGGLVLSGSTFYGTAYTCGQGPGNGFGTVFKVTTSGSFTTLYAFNGGTDGGGPVGGLVLSGGTLYGTASMGGEGSADGNAGEVFQISASGNNFKTLHTFGNNPNDGENPYSTLLMSGTMLYGTATAGGAGGNGTVYGVGVSGTAKSFSVVYSFSSTYSGTNSDGGYPYASLILSSGTFYGAAVIGGAGGNGALYSVTTSGSHFTNFHSFSSGNGGEDPTTILILSGTTFYGTTFGETGGPDVGTIFSVHTDGSGYTTLHVFAFPSIGQSTYNNDGENPDGGLALSGSTLYGTALFGGTEGGGTFYKVNVDGSGFAVLYNFSMTGGGAYAPTGAIALSGSTIYGTTDGGTIYSISTNGSNYTDLSGISDGAGGVILSGSTLYGGASGQIFKLYTNGTGFTTIATPTDPVGSLALSGATLYGVDADGGSIGWGSVYSVNTDGSDFTTLTSLGVGDRPGAGVLLSGTTLYGTTTTGGPNGSGNIFSLGVNGAGFQTLYNFSSQFNSETTAFSNGDGAIPTAGLILSGTTLYGTASQGGTFNNGTVFSLVP
jgi:uncharacterized repeat protein (TIGR03803 family)